MQTRRGAFQGERTVPAKTGLDFPVALCSNGLCPLFLHIPKAGGVLLYVGQGQGRLLGYRLETGDSFLWARNVLGALSLFFYDISA